MHCKEPDAYTNAIRRNSLVLAGGRPAAGDSAGRSTARTGVLQGGAGALRARRWAPLGGVDLRADGDRRRADTDVRHQPAATGCASPKAHRSDKRAHSVGQHEVGGDDLGHDGQLGRLARAARRSSTNRSTSSSRRWYRTDRREPTNTWTPSMDGIGCASNGARSHGRYGKEEICVPRPFATRWPSDRLVTRGIPIKSKASASFTF